MKLTRKFKPFLLLVPTILFFFPSTGHSEEIVQKTSVADVPSPIAADPASTSANFEHAPAALSEALNGNTSATSPELSPPSSATSTPSEETENKEFQPKVVITMQGQEMSLQVRYERHPMDFANENYIEYVRMESPEGEFLGLSTFNDQSQKATAEFMINPKLAKFDTVRLVAKSAAVGLIKTSVKLELTAPETPLVTAETANTSASSERKSGGDAKSQSRKKLFGFF